MGTLTVLPLSLLCSPAFCPPAKALFGIFQNLSLPLKEILLSFLFTKGNLDIFTRVTSAELCATPLSDRAPLQNFTLPNFPSRFCHPRIEITCKSSRLVLHRRRFTVPLPGESASPLGGSFTHQQRRELNVGERNTPGLPNAAEPRPDQEPLTGRGTRAQHTPAPRRGWIWVWDTGQAALPCLGDKNRVCRGVCARWVLTPIPCSRPLLGPGRSSR